jgi:hypothetical protein
MEESKPALIVLLTMHRCGSSLATSLLQRLGMSLGPYELLGANPSNPHGHFESVPFLELNRKVQRFALGFADDIPDTEETLARFLQSRGRWNAGIRVPEEMLAEGRWLIKGLVASGDVSGFKDPRTVLTWPFWRQVLEEFPAVRVVPVGLIRTPHEIAMSLVTRAAGRIGYWTALDVVAVHFDRQKEILDSVPGRPPCVSFGSREYLENLEVVAEYCGLKWDRETMESGVDPECVHHVPAAVRHASQSYFASLRGPQPVAFDREQDDSQLEADARRVDKLRVAELRAADAEIDAYRQRARDADARIGELERRAQEQSDRFLEAMSRLADVQSQSIAHQRELAEMLQAERSKLADVENRLILSQLENQHLIRRLDKIESHALLGPAVRARRGVRKLVEVLSADQRH